MSSPSPTLGFQFTSSILSFSLNIINYINFIIIIIIIIICIILLLFNIIII